MAIPQHSARIGGCSRMTEQEVRLECLRLAIGDEDPAVLDADVDCVTAGTPAAKTGVDCDPPVWPAKTMSPSPRRSRGDRARTDRRGLEAFRVGIENFVLGLLPG